MVFPTLYNLNDDYRTPLAILLLFVFVSNLVFVFVLLPTKEAKAAYPVSIVGDIFEALKAAWRALMAAASKITAWATSFTAWIKGWEFWRTILGDIVKNLVLAILYKILAMVTNDIIRWINGGEEPRFISNWVGYLRNAAMDAGGIFVQLLGFGFLCQPFQAQIQVAIRSASMPYQSYARCTLGSMGANLGSFFNNFAGGGGWNTWLQVIQPQNNFYGSYLMAQDEYYRRIYEAAEAAKNEGLASGGFVSPKKCEKCHVVNIETSESMIFETAEGCGQARVDPNYSFMCLKETIQTPGSIVQGTIQEAVNAPMKLIRETIASITGNLDDAVGLKITPFLQAIFAALINRLIGMGLGALTGIGANYEDDLYYYYLEDPTIFPPLPHDPVAEITEDLPTARLLLDQQKLLLENLQDELLPAVEQKYAILQQIEQVQISALETLVEITKQPNCSLPSWATMQLLSSQTTSTSTIQTYRITATDIGNIVFKKTTVGGSFEFENISYEILATNPQTIPVEELDETNQWIADVETAISSTQDYIAAAEDYLAIYEQTATSTATSTQEVLTAAEDRVRETHAKMIADAQKAANSSATDLYQLLMDTQSMSIQVVILAAEIQNSLSSNTYQNQLQSMQSKLFETQSILNTCIAAQQQTELPVFIKLWD